jgi:hypothetical protein
MCNMYLLYTFKYHTVSAHELITTWHNPDTSFKVGWIDARKYLAPGTVEDNDHHSLQQVERHQMVSPLCKHICWPL